MSEGVPGTAQGSEDPISFEQVFQEELKCIRRSRRSRSVTVSSDTDTAADPNTLSGLAFSGGGIRSATFNLGILQALARKRLLCKFDYLSTVSGGGYIGSWLAGFTERFPQGSPRKFDPIERALGEQTYYVGKPAEAKAIRWLRNYADYLTPQTGVLSGDTGAMLGTWLRNVILNLIVVILFLLGATLVPHLQMQLTRVVVFPHPILSFAVGVVLLVVATFYMGLSMVDFIRWEDIRKKNWFRRNRVAVAVMLPYFTSAWLINASMWIWPAVKESKVWWWSAGGALFYALIWLLTFWLSQYWKDKNDPDDQAMVSWTWVVISALGAGAVGGFFFNRYAWVLSRISQTDAHTWSVVIFGTVALMLLMETVAAFQLGLLGIDCLDLVREWWARAGGRLIQVMGVWVVTFGIVVFGPLAVRMLLKQNIGSLGAAAIAWLISNFTGIMAAKSPKTGGDIKSTSAVMKAVSDSRSTSWWRAPKVLDFVAKVAPYIFAIGLLVGLATAVHILCGLFLASTDTAAITRHLWLERSLWASTSSEDVYRAYWTVQSSATFWKVLLASAFLIAASTALSWRIDINDFSLHHFYRNRLVRCYLGASRLRDRRPQPFTGFDPHDDIPLEKFGAHDYPGPYPILNTSLNVSRGGELGFEARRAKSFVFTPLYCGYDLAANMVESGEKTGSYMKTVLGRKKFGSNLGISLGTAMAISGAAASPNMGHYTSPAAAFFMTLFDVRLGWWMGNPRHEKRWESSGPRPALGYLVKELVAQSDEESNYTYLSDGGHFENLAIYELVKRRCRFIMVCDSGADLGYGCGDLMAAIEKCRTDFGVDIKISISDIKPKDQCLSVKNFAVGEIHYGPGDQGVLVYVKSSLPVDSPDPNTPLESRLAAGVRSYADAHPDFPHQSTADQWFDEVQFEAYRALGEYIGSVVGDAIHKTPDDKKPAVLKS